MNRRQNNDLAMYDEVIAYLTLCLSIWTNNAAITALVNSFKANITIIRNKEGIQNINWKGATITKNELWDMVALMTFQICEGMKGYYLGLNDQTGFGTVNFPLSYFKECDKEAAIDRMRIINGIASGISPVSALADYSITASILSDHSDAVTTLATAMTIKREKAVEKSDATTDIANEFKLNKAILKQLDGLINAMILTQKAFVEGYRKARIVIDLGKGHQTAAISIEPNSTKAVSLFENKFKAGYSFLIRNNGDEDIAVGLAAKAGDPPTDATKNTITRHDRLVLALSKDGNFVGLPFLSIVGLNKFVAVKVTVFMIKGVSHSKAGSTELSGQPKPQ